MWNGEFSDGWIPLLEERGSLTANDVADLNARVDTWRSEMTPTSPFIYALIFIVIVSLLTLAYVRFIRNKPLSG